MLPKSVPARSRVRKLARVIPFPRRRPARGGHGFQNQATTPLPAPSLLRRVRAYWRLFRVFQHLIWGCLIVACSFRFRSVASQRKAKRAWSRQLLGCLGVRLDVHGGIPEGGVLVVANHISWLDIYVINAIRACAFVCKEEVRAWPVIGWLVARSETIFIQRGNKGAAKRTAEMLQLALNDDAAIVVFPEGTTTNGEFMLPFRPALLQAAVDADVPVVPVAIRYRDRGHAISPAAAYDGDVTLWQCMRAIALTDGMVAEATVLPALDPRQERQHLASHARARIGERLGFVHAEPDAPGRAKPRTRASDAAT